MTAAESVLFALGLAVGPIAFLLVLLGAQVVLAPHKPGELKGSHYECGIPQASSPWAPVNVRFATVAILFVVFDAETALMFAVAPAVKGDPAGALELAAFAAFLALGLVYAWKKGALKWPS